MVIHDGVHRLACMAPVLSHIARVARCTHEATMFSRSRAVVNHDVKGIHTTECTQLLRKPPGVTWNYYVSASLTLPSSPWKRISTNAVELCGFIIQCFAKETHTHRGGIAKSLLVNGCCRYRCDMSQGLKALTHAVNLHRGFKTIGIVDEYSR